MQCVSKDYPVSFVVTDPKGTVFEDINLPMTASVVFESGSTADVLIMWYEDTEPLFDSDVMETQQFVLTGILDIDSDLLPVDSEAVTVQFTIIVEVGELVQATVTFNSNGGSAVISQTVYLGDKVIKPTDPTRKGYIFTGWFKDSTLKTAWDFNHDIVVADITLYAKWKENQDGNSQGEDNQGGNSQGNGNSQSKFTITFNTNGGSSVNSQTINSGKTASKPSNPNRAGYTFDGWYSDAALTMTYNFSSKVTDSITLYAKWTLNVTHIITFNSNGGSSVASQTVDSGGTVKKPSNPTLRGYSFDAWYSDAALKNKYNFSTPVTADITLYSKWNVGNSQGGNSQ